MAIEIPTRNDIPSYTFRIDLDGVTYTLGIRYNERMDRWIMDFKTENSEDIINGIPLLLGVSLLGRFKDTRLPPGDLFMINIENENIEANRDNFGTNAKLLYEPV